MDSTRRKQIRDYLRDHSVMTLASVGPDGPWASAVFYSECPDGLIFLSSPKSRHSHNLASDPRVAATIQDDTSDWTAVKGLQIGGSVEQLEGNSMLAKRRLFEAKFPIANRLQTIPRSIAQALDRVAWFILKPDTMLFIDNEVGFGHRESVSVDVLINRGSE